MTLEANELRIGNLIHESVSNTDGIVNMTILKILEDNPAHTYEPVILTEEWLKEDGYEENGGGEWSKFPITLDMHVDGYFVLVQISGVEIPAHTAIKYVHHLQNLRIDLTGKENK